MNVSRLQIVARGLSVRCPNCGGRTLFKKGTLFRINPSCPLCGMTLDRDEFFLGSMSLNYGVTVVLFLAPDAWLAYKGAIGTTLAIVLAGVGAILLPALLYRPSRSWFLMNYYLFLPQHLPANRPDRSPGDDENV